VAPRGVTGTPPAGERRGLVPARPANAAVAGPVSAGCGQAKAAPGLPPARAGLSVRAVVCHAAGGQSPPHPPIVAALRGRTFGLSSRRALCCASRPLATRAPFMPEPSVTAFCSPACPCCSFSLETTQCNPLVALASRPASLPGFAGSPP